MPVDLNSILQKNAEILSTWFNKMGNKMKADKYCVIAQQFLKNIHEVKVLNIINAFIYINSINIIYYR